MGIGYVFVVLVIIFINIFELLVMLFDIVKLVFGLQEVGVGVFGVVIKNGIQCGLYLNEVGSGFVLYVVVSVVLNFNYFVL